MEFNILTDKSAAKEVVVEGGRVPYPIERTIKWHSAKTPEMFAKEEATARTAANAAHWSTYQRSEVEGVKGENVKVENFSFAIIATGFRVVNVDEANKEYWQSSLCLDSRTDLVTVWNKVANKPLFSCSYAEYKEKIFPNLPKSKYSTSIIAVDLNTQTIVEIAAGGLLIEALCKDAGTFLGKKPPVFGLATEPPLVFQKSKTKLCHRLDKEAKLWVNSGECYHLPAHTVGVFPKDSDMHKVIMEQKELFKAWAESSIKKIGQTVEQNAEALPTQEPLIVPPVTNESAIRSAMENVYGAKNEPPVVNIENLDDSGDGLPF